MLRVTKMLLACVLVLLFCGSVAEARGYRRGGYSGSSAGYSSPSNVQNVAYKDESPVYDAEKDLLDAVNAERRRFGLSPLVLDPTIHLSARSHCLRMLRSGAFSHSGGPYAENIAMGQRSVREVMSSWMNSSGHRANILNPGYTHVGLSGYISPSGQIYWTQMFVRKAGN